jgi:hypothetical protein
MDDRRNSEDQNQSCADRHRKLGVRDIGNGSYDFTGQQNTALAVTIPATLRISNVVRINLNAGWLWDRVAEQQPMAPESTGARPTMSGH